MGEPMHSVNGGYYPFDGGQHRKPQGLWRAAAWRVSPHGDTNHVVVMFRIGYCRAP